MATCTKAQAISVNSAAIQSMNTDADAESARPDGTSRWYLSSVFRLSVPSLIRRPSVRWPLSRADQPSATPSPFTAAWIESV